MAVKNSQRFAEIERLMGDYFGCHLAPVMGRVQRDLSNRQADEMRAYSNSTAGILRSLATANMPGDDPYATLKITGKWNSKTTEDYLAMCKEAIVGNKDMQRDLAVMAEEWRKAVVTEIGRERYDALSKQLGCDLAYAYIDHRMEQLMIEKMVKDRMPTSSADYIIRKAIAAGVDPVVAVRMGTLVPCQYFGLAHSGAIAPGYTADLIVLSNLEQFTVEQVYKKGKLVAQQGRMLHPAALTVDKARFVRVFDSFNMDEIIPEQLQLKQTGTRQRVICLTPHALLTTEKIVPFCQHPGTAPGVDVAQKIVKLAVFERHHRSGHVGLGFLGNYGLQCGAVASSIAHDSHNLIVAGTNDADMVLAGNTVRKNKGGLAFALNGQVVGELPLPVAGLMSTESAESVEEKLQALKAALKAHGISEDIDAFMTLAFVSLPVIPKLRLNTYGIVDVDAQRIVPAVF